jgi:hypothetical protein
VGRISAEARARVAAEADLLKRRKVEFERLLKTKSRVAAIVTLVDKYKIEYGQMVTAYRARFEAEATAA